jgi:hypothetical protein
MHKTPSKYMRTASKSAMGSSGAVDSCIGSTSQKKNRLESVAAALYGMGSSQRIGGSSQKIYGPRRAHWQLHLRMRWAHPSALAAAAREIMGPGEAIGSSTWVLKWAHSSESAAAPRKMMGPGEAIVSYS